MIKTGMPILYEYDNVEDNFKLAKKLKLDFVELNLNFSYCRQEMENHHIEELLKKYNLETTLHFYDEADFASYQEVVDAYLFLLDKYLSLGINYIKQVNIHSLHGPVVTISGEANYIYAKEYDDYFHRLVNNLNKAKDICDKYNVNLVIENTSLIPQFMQQTWSDLNKLGFVFCYDIGHDRTAGNYLQELIKTNIFHFGEFHIHDGNEKKCHLALGEGDINIKYFKHLANYNNAYVVLEVKQVKDLLISVPLFNKI